MERAASEDRLDVVCARPTIKHTRQEHTTRKMSTSTYKGGRVKNRKAREQDEEDERPAVEHAMCKTKANGARLSSAVSDRLKK